LNSHDSTVFDPNTGENSARNDQHQQAQNNNLPSLFQTKSPLPD
jgi:hypothetical protein